MMLKRLFRTPAFCAMLALVFVCVLLCGSLQKEEGIPKCGIALGSDPTANALAAQLTADGLVAYETEDALRRAVARGEIAMGAVLPSDLTSRLASGDTNGMIAFLESPSAVLQPLYRYRIAAHLMEAYAPYLTSDLLADAGVTCTSEEMRAEIDAYLADEAEFAFTFTTAAGAAVESVPISRRLTAGAVALLLFFAMPLFACPCTEGQLSAIRSRIGAAQAFKAYALPSILWVLFLFAAVTAGALALSDALFDSGTAVLIPAAGIYCIFLSALGVLCSALLRDTAKLRMPMIVLCLLSLGFCPIFADLPALLGISAWPRLLLPPTFFYAAAESPHPSAVAAALLLPAAIAVYRKRFR